MAPKPFPYPLGIGTDICHLPRIFSLMQKENTVNLWSRKVFTRLEWPSLVRKFNKSLSSPTDLPVNDADLSLELPRVWETMIATGLEPRGPRLKTRTKTLAQFLAGRFLPRQILFSA